MVSEFWGHMFGNMEFWDWVLAGAGAASILAIIWVAILYGILAFARWRAGRKNKGA